MEANDHQRPEPPIPPVAQSPPRDEEGDREEEGNRAKRRKA